MVYNTDTLIPCHELTLAAKLSYQQMLEYKADQILQDAAHPIQAFCRKMIEKIVDLFS